MGSDVIGSAQSVSYLSTYPSWTPQLLAQDGLSVLLTKSKDWSYEREYRIIGFAEGVEMPVKDHPLFIKSGYLEIADGTLTAIIAGCEANFEAVKSVVRKCSSKALVKRAVRAAGRYELEIIS